VHRYGDRSIKRGEASTSRSGGISNVAKELTLTRGMVALVLSSALIIAILTPLEPIDYAFSALSTNFGVTPETFIIFSDLLLLSAGFLLGYSTEAMVSVGASRSNLLSLLYSHLRSVNGIVNERGLLSLGAAALLIAYWHLPLNLDIALLDFQLHLIMNMSLLLAGFLIFLGANRLDGKTHKAVTILSCKAMGIFGIYLLVTSEYNQFYTVYPLAQQAQLGLVMVIMMFLIDGLLVPYWLYRFFSKPTLPLSKD
jgi:hypothetical protein